jgi:hypothetical protein
MISQCLDENMTPGWHTPSSYPTCPLKGMDMIVRVVGTIVLVVGTIIAWIEAGFDAGTISWICGATPSIYHLILLEYGVTICGQSTASS